MTQPTIRQRIWANLWAAQYLARLAIRYRLDTAAIAHHTSCELAHRADQANGR